jgi:hypothetical protein
MYFHLVDNPCLYESWNQLWPRLQEHGWEAVNLNKTPLNIVGLPAKQRLVFGYRLTELRSTELLPGITVFGSMAAVMEYIARFPYLLQDRNVLENNLLRLGWTRNNKGFRFPRNNDL